MSTPGAVDLTPITNALNLIAFAIAASTAPANPIDLTPITAALDQISSAISNVPPFDQTNLAELAAPDTQGTTDDDAFIDYLVEQGALDQGVATALKGTQ